MNIFCHVPRENWIVDRMGLEYKKHSRHNVSLSEIKSETDCIWLLAGWCWDHIPQHILEKFFVFCTIHHVVPAKFKKEKFETFKARDHFVDRYLTYTEKTKNFIKQYTNKPITVLNHWINDEIWEEYDKNICKSELKLPNDKLIISSFQRDTEGKDLITPKLEKGPDIFVDKVKNINKFTPVHVLLGGWRRHYVISQLIEFNIDYTYIELADIIKLNKMYCASDLYIVSSREEGGPQAIFEASFLKIPIISTDVGQSKILLDKNCIYDQQELITINHFNNAKKSIELNYNNVKKFKLKNCIKVYDDIFENIDIINKKCN